MSTFLFGSGAFFLVPKKTNPTPIQLGSLQETSIEFSASIKSLAGSNRFAEAVGQGATKVTGKSKFAKIRVAAYNELFFNETVHTGMTLVALNELGTIPAAAGPYTITVANSAKFSRDLGVIDYLTGKPLTCVASAPATGQYSVAAGVYTFAAADTGKQVFLSYIYTDSASGSTITINNQPIGEAVSFMGVFNGRFSGKQTTLILNSCVTNKLSLLGTKTEDFSIPEFDFEASTDTSNVLGLLSSAD